MVDVELLRNLIPLNDLAEETLRKVADQLVPEPYPAGTVICDEGDTEDTAIYLIEGGVELVSTRSTMRRVVQAGTADASFAVAKARPRPDTITATTAIKLIRVDNSKLDRVVLFDELTTTLNTLQKSEKKAESDNEWMDRMLNTDAFANIPEANLGPILLKMEGVHIKKGAAVISQNEEGRFYYVIKRGEFNVARRDSKGMVNIVAKLGPGAVFGEESLVSGQGASASVVAITDATVMRLSRDDFDDLVKKPLLKHVTREKASQLAKNGAIILDVRTEEEFARGSLRGSINIPLESIRNGIDKLDKTRNYIVCCRSGVQSAVAGFLMSQRGLEVSVLQGGLVKPKKPAIDEVSAEGQDQD
ncbi:MAG: cyclic nucleotide-binding domain-containing protein [Gammaproteobacteria bacterium]|nr:cyclic nucleotide-binding domain-containing protein [Gammaproteobacteria bacterium]